MLQEKFATAPKMDPYHWTGTNVAGCENWDKRVGRDNLSNLYKYVWYVCVERWDPAQSLSGVMNKQLVNYVVRFRPGWPDMDSTPPDLSRP
jgi:hypothetical protein